MTFGHWGKPKKDEAITISPPTFTNLWNDVVAARCNELERSEAIGKASTRQHMSGRGTLYMWLEGKHWNEELRDEMVDVLWQAFDRAVVREYSDNGFQMYEWGPKDLFALRKNGQHLRMTIRTQSESVESCGDSVSRILELGGLIYPIFGLVSVARASK